MAGMYSAAESKGGYYKFHDVEAGRSDILYPGLSEADSAMRWGFVRKVYGILSAQLVLSLVVGSLMVFNGSVPQFLAANPGLSILTALLPLFVMIPLYCYRQSHPINLALLGLFTLSISLSVGVVCSLYSGLVVLEALGLTAAIVVSLTAYTFYAVKQGKDFGFLGPVLFATLMAMVIWSFVQFFFNPGPMGVLYIVYDTDQLIKTFDYDDYIWASVHLYLDVINLFLRLLQILDYLNGRN
eukprot:jgi/Mesvir1/4748/Mv05537-RA.2